MHELFAKSASLSPAETASDFLVVNGRAPSIQVVMSDEIEQAGACQALMARGANIVASDWSNAADSQIAFSSEAEIVVVSWTNHDMQSDFDIPLLIDALGTGSDSKLVMICPPLSVDSFRKQISQLSTMSLVVSRDEQSVTELLVRTTRRLLNGEHDSNIEPPPSLASPRILEASRLVEILTFREAQILGLISLGLSNGQIAEKLGIKIRTVNNFIRATFIKLRLSGDTSINSRVSACLAYSVYLGLGSVSSSISN